MVNQQSQTLTILSKFELAIRCAACPVLQNGIARVPAALFVHVALRASLKLKFAEYINKN